MNPPREAARKRLEVFPEPFPLAAVFAEELRVVETSPRTWQAHPVQRLEKPHDLVLRRLSQRDEDAVGGGRRFCFHPVL